MVTVPQQASSLLQDFAPQGALRVAINLGNPMLAGLDAQGMPCGVSVDMATELGKRLGVAVSLVTVDGAAKSVALVRAEEADIGFFALDPLRSDGIAFSAAYVLIEGAYLVRQHSPIQSNAEVDQPGNRIVVGKGSAYDLFLSRHIKSAELVRVASGEAVMPAFHEGQFEVAAGIRQPLERHVVAGSGLRMLDGRFMVIEQAMGMPASRSNAAIAFLREFVEQSKATGLVATSLASHAIQGASVAPAA